MNDLRRSFRAFEGKNHPKVKNFIDNIQYQSIKTLKENPEFAKIIDEANSEVDLPLGDNIIELNKKLGEKFICIIDEWDLIFRNFKDDLNLQYKFIDFLNGMFKSTGAGNCFSLVYMTGILPIKKYESHSLLNNFKEYNMLEPRTYAKFFGFTNEEVKELVNKFNDSVSYEELKEWYDGYKLKGIEIYNPYSVGNAITDH